MRMGTRIDLVFGLCGPVFGEIVDDPGNRSTALGGRSKIPSGAKSVGVVPESFQ